MKEILKSDSICQSYGQIKKGSVFFDSQCVHIICSITCYSSAMFLVETTYFQLILLG